ncbi:2-dehydro-3-deoxygalactonokinase [Halomonas sp. DP8Y7-1]|uniref:2-dehydro-3-deoxygalactonokinase n=1 Tax=Halomonas sp. DP8Y7-1 TaxID=2859078 RepID=UPI001C95ED32|nr:2-dehydro-3-deoxygalactonokinase [Halomonas sp. DP8Y7-1]MBY6028035.1 2-dehydro-3-deoxygalactonokinase [Halomonas sp. DP8Y7-1]
MPSPVMIGIDWGTSSFRASLVDRHGEALESRESPHGILAVPDRDFAGFLRHTIDDWLAAHPGMPILASGMITSRNGWIETPYQPLPLGIKELAHALVSADAPGLGQVHFVTGAVQSPEGERPDVIRGEETEIFGYLATQGVSAGTFLLPGTHNKWLTVEQGRITRFVTCMTGELYALLREHSLLGRTMRQGEFCPEAFVRGVQTARRHPGELLATLFTTRSLHLFDQLSPEHSADYLSGLLIGEECLGQLRLGPPPEQVTIIGRPDLAERYRIATELLSLPSTLATPGLSRHGQLAIARAAELIPC